jgi:S1-C subfamily serine protease
MNKKVSLSIIILVLSITMLACQVSGFVPTGVAVATPTTSSPLTPAQPVNLGDQQDQLVSLFQMVSPGVVTILAGNALGSGWVYNMDGYIVTNAHVVGSETKVEVDFPDGTKVYGQVAGVDQNSDLAVIKVDVPAAQLHPLSLGDSDNLKVGQVVAAIGDPLALNGTTLTTGVVAGLGRSEESNNQTTGGAYFAAGDFIETDALLNHGNSGGPLLTLNGQVVGVNRSIQIDPSSGVPSGLGYAISVNVVKRVIPELIQKGKFDYPYLGISFLPNGLTLDVISVLNLKSTTGAYITEITAGGPADKAGLIAGTTPTSIQGLNSGGDLIVAVDDQPVQEFNDLMRYIVVHKAPGDTIALTVMRGDQKVKINLTLGVRP